MINTLLSLAVVLAPALAIGSKDRVIAPTVQCPDCALTPSDLIEYWGYPVERHTIATADGYLLNVYRIPYGMSAKARAMSKQSVRPAVLLQHGLLDACTTWILNLPHQSLGFMLADQGFDVWLGNSRGNTWSLPNCSSEDCWDFSFDDMAQYDLPAMVEFILQKTGLPSIGYVGHSQGTIEAFAGFSINAELQKKVNVFAALAPVAYVFHQESKLVNFLASIDADKLFLIFGLKDFLPSSSLIRFLGGFCPLPFIDAACEDILFVLCGSNPEVAHNLNASRMDVYVSHTPAGTSTKNMAHWAQMVRQNRFGMYDYGSSENLKRYGTQTPPDYKLSNVKLPVALFTGANDLLADPLDVERMIAELSPNSNIVIDEKYSEYDHLDFVWGLDAHQVLYPDVIAVLKKYAPVHQI